MKQTHDKSTIEMPLCTPANPLTEAEIRNQLKQIASGSDKKAAKIAREALRKRMRYKCADDGQSNQGQ